LVQAQRKEVYAFGIILSYTNDRSKIWRNPNRTGFYIQQRECISETVSLQIDKDLLENRVYLSKEDSSRRKVFDQVHRKIAQKIRSIAPYRQFTN